MPPADHWTLLMQAVVAQRDRSAFTEIFDHFTPRLEAYLARLGLDAATAEEITQDVMMTLWRKAELFDPAKSSLATWLYRIARNRRIDFARRARTESIDPHSPAILEIADETRTDSDLDGRQRDDTVRALIDDLPAEQRDLVKLAFYSGMTHHQLAAHAGLPLGTVKSRLRLAFAKLRRGLEAGGIGEAR